MTQALVSRQQFSPEDLTLLRRTLAPGTTDDQFMLFVRVCVQTGLNPFARQIYAVVRNERQKNGSYEPKMTIQTSIDGYRLLAQRSGEYAGQEGPFWYDAEVREWTDVWVKDEPPAAAKVGVMRAGFVKPIWAVARFESYAVRAYNPDTKRTDGPLTNLWAKMPELMIGKVAEALALRRAFPAELSGLYTAEEMAQADTLAPVVTKTGDPDRKQRLNTLYEQGREKGLFADVTGMAVFISEVLEEQVDVSQIRNLSDDELIRVEYAIAGAQGLAS